MCRVALFNHKGYELIEAKTGLDYFFLELEMSQGGHGNGVALLNKGRITIYKGVAFDALVAAEYVREQPFEWCLFHTRLASAGSVRDDNCHPFEYGNTVLAMNGTESGFGSLGQMMGGKTDTEALLLTLHQINAPMPDSLRYFSSVFMGFHNRRPFVVSGGWGDLEVYKEGKALVFASELPEDWKGVLELDFRKTFFWYGGRVPYDVLKVRYGKGRKRKRFDLYNDWEDDCYVGISGRESFAVGKSS